MSETLQVSYNLDLCTFYSLFNKSFYIPLQTVWIFICFVVSLHSQLCHHIILRIAYWHKVIILLIFSLFFHTSHLWTQALFILISSKIFHCVIVPLQAEREKEMGWGKLAQKITSSQNLISQYSPSCLIIKSFTDEK